MSDSALFKSLSDILTVLDDHHVNLVSPFAGYNSGVNRNKNDFDFKVVKNNYLKNSAKEQIFVPGPNNNKRSLLKSGIINYDIAYLHIGGFKNAQELVPAFDSLLKVFSTTKGLIIDLRNDGGGTDELVQTLSGRFVNDRTAFLNIKFRYGIKHSDYTSPAETFYMEPSDAHAYAKPIVILSNRNTASAAENFILAMRTLNNVRVIGDTTAGVFATSLHGVLPNGWEFSCSNAVYKDLNGKCYEGIGLFPDYYAANTQKELQSGKDNVLETAIAAIDGSNVISKRYFNKGKGVAKISIARYMANSKEGHSAVFFNQCQNLIINNSYYYSDREMIEVFAGNIDKADSAELVRWLGFMKINTKKTLYTTLVNYLYYVAIDNTRMAEACISEMQKTGMVEEMLYDEDFLNNAGYAFAGKKSPRIALEILNSNAKLHPASPNVYDSLGEIYMKTGDTKNALINYKKLLDLDPANDNAKKILEKYQQQNKSK